MFNARQFCDDYNIEYAKTGQYYRNGWTNIRCPFCNSSNHTLGICHKNNMTTCYKCGGKNLKNLIWALKGKLNLNGMMPKTVIEKYKNVNVKKEVVRTGLVCKMPNCQSLTYNHAQYLKGRGFNPYQIAYKYNIISAKNYTDYYGRIIIPIYYKNQIVSYQGRDTTRKSDLRYMSCKEENEVIKHKRTLYNIDNCENDTVLVVEGITDVWRIGNNSVCTFGITYTPYQVVMLSNFKKVYILYDNEPVAQRQADKLYYDLKSMNTEAEIIEMDDGYEDPAEMKDEDVKYLKKTLNI